MSAPKRLSQREFVTLIALNYAMIAASIDGILPGLTMIGAELSTANLNSTQLVITSFILGMGLGTLFAGPISDSIGRKPVVALGVAVFVIGSISAAHAQSLEMLIASRLLQGLGAAGPRIVAIAMVRDLYVGREMASIMSYVFMVFTLVPAIAPLLGSLVIDASGWRAVFYALSGFACLSAGLLLVRQPETLPKSARRAFSFNSIWTATKLCFAKRRFSLSVFCQALSYGTLFAALSSIPQIFEITYDRGESFPLWFGLIAILGGCATVVNARVVKRLGMRRMVIYGLGSQSLISAAVVGTAVLTSLPFAIYFVWTASIFFMAGLVLGNLNALAMEPLGKTAGLAASIIGFVATVASVVIAVPLGLAFDGTALPLAAGIFGLSTLGVAIMRFGLR